MESIIILGVIGYIGRMEKKMETTTILGVIGYIGIMEKKMETTTILGVLGVIESASCLNQPGRMLAAARLCILRPMMVTWRLFAAKADAKIVIVL